MLGEVTSEEITEWQAYYSIREKYNDDLLKQQQAKAKAAKQGR